MSEESRMLEREALHLETLKAHHRLALGQACYAGEEDPLSQLAGVLFDKALRIGRQDLAERFLALLD